MNQKTKVTREDCIARFIEGGYTKEEAETLVKEREDVIIKRAKEVNMDPSELLFLEYQTFPVIPKPIY